MNKVDGYESRATIGDLEVRANEDGSHTIRGLAAVYDSLSENLGGFREIIEPGAFEESNLNDVRALFNHDSNFVLGRTTSKTLRLQRTQAGLRFSVDVPNTRTIMDMVVEPIKRGDVSQASFGFTVGRGNESWDENDEGVIIRTLHRIQRVFDVSPVTFPAYADTSVAVRSLDKVKHELHGREADEIKRETEARARVVTLVERGIRI
jgi:HK97 family phage prohead protease